MHLIRSFLFAIILALVTIPYALFGILIFWAPPMTRHRLITTWVPIMMWVIRHVLGIRYRVIGRENLPATASVVLSKHQSAWETIALQLPRTNNAGAPSFTDGKWWWSLEDPAHPRFRLRRGGGAVEDFACERA